MSNKPIHEFSDSQTGDTNESRHIKFNAHRAKIALKEQRRAMQKKIFGDHYNYSKIGLNKEKKYWKE